MNHSIADVAARIRCMKRQTPKPNGKGRYNMERHKQWGQPKQTNDKVAGKGNNLERRCLWRGNEGGNLKGRA